MAIAQVLRGAARAAKILGKRKSKQAIRASKSTLSQAQNLTSKAGTKLKGVAAAAAGTRTAQMAAEGTKNIASKIGKKLPEGLKSAAKSTATKMGTAGSAAASMAKKASITAKEMGNKARDLGNKVISDADIAATATKRATVGAAGVAAAKTIKAAKAASKAGKEFATEKPFLAGMTVQSAIDLPIIVGTAALTASVASANTPKESLYKQQRMNDGKFSTTYQDSNKNAVISNKQLSAKETDDVRSYIAVLDSIVMSDDPQKRKNEFIAVLDQLQRKYGISSIQGKNLSVMLPS